MNIILGIIIIGIIFVIKYVDYGKMVKEYEGHKEAIDRSVEIYREKMEKMMERIDR